jgi:hypothetical protein
MRRLDDVVAVAHHPVRKTVECGKPSPVRMAARSAFYFTGA